MLPRWRTEEPVGLGDSESSFRSPSSAAQGPQAVRGKRLFRPLIASTWFSRRPSWISGGIWRSCWRSVSPDLAISIRVSGRWKAKTSRGA